MSTILIVDDRAEGRYYLRAVLETEGWTAQEASDGEEALATARQAPPDLVISDLLMPTMDGYTLLRHWVGDPQLQGIPFIVLSATYRDEEDQSLAFSLGARAFLLKPAEPDQIVRAVASVLAGGGGRAAKSQRTPAEESELQQRYSAALIRKLGLRTLQLEAANQALRQEHAEVELRDRAMRAVSQGILIVDAQQPYLPVIYASPSCEQLTGFAPHEFVGRNCRFLQGRETDPATVAILHEALAAGRACTVEILNYRKDQTTFWNLLSVHPVRGANGRLSHFVGVQTDVSERRTLEGQLRQAQKMEGIGQLAAGIAHDFNNLLSVILGFTSGLLDDLPPGTVGRADLEEVRRAGERAAALTKQLLAFSRKQILQPRVLVLGELVAGLEPLLRSLLGAAIELSLFVSNSAKVFADPTQLELALMNLVVNARDAMPTGGKLSIELAEVCLDSQYVSNHLEVIPGTYVRLAVTDSGSGIEASTRERIFEPFFTNKELGRGTGLGLATVFGIVKQSGGHIWVYSEPGLGATFKVYLPVVDRALALAAAPILRADSLRGTETILVVEDEEQVRRMICSLLRRQGYNVLEAQNGGEAFLIAEQKGVAIDLLLTDVVMPRLSGIQLAERLRPLRPDMAVVFMSGYTEATLLERHSLQPGFTFLQKPVTRDELLRKLREALAARPPSAVPGAS